MSHLSIISLSMTAVNFILYMPDCPLFDRIVNIKGNMIVYNLSVEEISKTNYKS